MPDSENKTERERVDKAVNNGTDWVLANLDLSDRDTDLLNVAANAILSAYQRGGEASFDWDEFIAENWSAEPGDTDGDPRTWHDFWDD